MSTPMTPAQEKSIRRMARVIGIVFSCIGIYFAFNTLELKSEGLRTSGKVLANELIVFSAESGKAFEFRDGTRGLYRNRTGDTVTVLYLREDPRGSAIVERGLAVDTRGAWMFLLTGIFIAALYRERDTSAPEAFGFAGEEVERETPVLNDDKTFDSFIKETVMKYSLQRPGAPYGDWQLLQKFPKEGGLPNGFVLVAKDTSPQLTRALVPLAEEYGDDYYEFERSGDTVSVYCYKAGKSALKKLAAALSALKA